MLQRLRLALAPGWQRSVSAAPPEFMRSCFCVLTDSAAARARARFADAKFGAKSPKSAKTRRVAPETGSVRRGGAVCLLAPSR